MYAQMAYPHPFDGTIYQINRKKIPRTLVIKSLLLQITHTHSDLRENRLNCSPQR